MAWQRIKTEVALVSVMCFIMFLGANHSWLEHTHGLAEKLTVNIMAPGKPSCWALWWWIWAFSGIILGCTIAWVHNKVSAIELPGALSMYGGAKLTLVAMTPVVIFYAIAFTWIWPFMTHGISALTGFMKMPGSPGSSSMVSLKNSLSPPACTISSGPPSSSPRLAAR